MVSYPHIFLSSILFVGASSFVYNYNTYGYFYKAVNHMFKGNIGISFLWCFYISCGFVIVELLSLLFFGPRTAIDVYIIYDKLWGSCIDVLFMVTLFRDALEPRYIVRICLMLAMNYFHWMFEERVNNLERLSIVPFIYNARIISVSFVLFFIDILVIKNTLTTLDSKSAMFFIFAQQMFVMSSHMVHDWISFMIILISKLKTDPMIYKMTYMQLLDFVSNLFRACAYLFTCIIFIMDSTFPIFNFLPLIKYISNSASSLISFIQNIRFLSVIRQQAIHLNEEEVSKLHDNTCIICREEMLEALQLPCKHAFHNNCLLYWVQSGRYCPVCREPISNFKKGNLDEKNDESGHSDHGIEVDETVENHFNEIPRKYSEHEVFQDESIPKNLRPNIPIFEFIPADYKNSWMSDKHDRNALLAGVLLDARTKILNDSLSSEERLRAACGSINIAIGILSPTEK